MKHTSAFFYAAGFLLLMLGHNVLGQGGPPFRTDDPETPGNRRWEINFGWVGDRNPAAGNYQVPDFDINYGLGDRIQLKYELPIAIEETRLRTGPEAREDDRVLAGLGESLLGVKMRFYEHHPGDAWLGQTPPGLGPPSTLPAERPVDFSISTYPQLSLNNPTRSVARGVVAPGPDFFLPLEANGRLGPLRWDGEAGYHFGNRSLAQSWIRGVLVGHEFSERTEAYAEIYDQQNANRTPPGRSAGPFATGGPKQRETTLGLGGRHALNKRKTFLLLLMGGRSFQTISAGNSQPSWIAYVGLQVLLGPEAPVSPPVDQKLPEESAK